MKNREGKNREGKITIKGREKGEKRKEIKVLRSYGKGEGEYKVKEIKYDRKRSGGIGEIKEIEKERREEIRKGRIVILGKGMRKEGIYKRIEEGKKEYIEEEKGKEGDEVRLKEVKIGKMIYNVEGKYMRSGGSYGVLKEKGEEKGKIRMKSGKEKEIEIRKMVRIGIVSEGKSVENEEKFKKGKRRARAGRSRWLGKRPKVRRKAKNSIDRR